MSEIELLMEDINKLRDNLQKLINEKEENLQNPDVLSASRMLNSLITEYNKFIKEKIKNK